MYNGPEEEKEDARHTQFLQFFFFIKSERRPETNKTSDLRIWLRRFPWQLNLQQVLSSQVSPLLFPFFWFTFLTTLTKSSYVQIDTPICPKSKKKKIFLPYRREREKLSDFFF